VQAPPHTLDVKHRATEIARMHRERHGVDRPRRGAAQDRKRVAGTLAAQFADRDQHAGLVGRTRATPGEHKPRPPLIDAHPPALAHAACAA